MGSYEQTYCVDLYYKKKKKKKKKKERKENISIRNGPQLATMKKSIPHKPLPAIKFKRVEAVRLKCCNYI